MNKETIRNITVRRMTVLVRADLNVPMEDGKIADDLRIRESLPTLELLRKKGARRIILISHLGRPEGKDKSLSLAPVAERLKELMPGGKVFFVADVSGPDVEEAVEKLPVGGILVLENLRFYKGEEQNSPEFAKEIVDATHADLFVQDGFAVCHRAHASTDAITKELPSVAGLLLEKEVTELSKISENPTHPFIVVIGGSKVEDKQPLIDKFAAKADQIVVGGKIAADGYTSALKNVYVAEDFSDESKLDLGPISTEKIVNFAKNAKTVLWNGLLGAAERPEYAHSSTDLALTLGETKNLTSVICGGDTTGFVENLMREREKSGETSLDYSLISTGGGAALEFLCGEPMPGIDSLDEK